ncbi:hypothetical protein Curi_c04270 [Gottschalkia acidurici 9a]|uniref:Uncharacterized protein n=1 Tax=Gottschalkia acidurici (strain ATCC 7906 / DSM 604 / BCRC 14475 / CIP 104303 / KCTC 5404 / NCIMB 10678 / 9a) TaxID=1128398 RepID=K0AXJ5_GOTA9|nr:hypothetical protein [Gottschalkia acidurici]AFS77502.1 hypothetical protein Curi_c04270 [Gottschalkia acidurici 9a]
MFLLIGINLGFNKLVNTEYQSLNDMDKNMLKQISQVYETYNNESQNIWKEGYNFNNIPLVLTPVNKDKGMIHAYSYVIGVDKLEKSIFSKRIEVPKEVKLPPIYRVSSLSPSLIRSWIPANFSFKNIGEQHVTFFKYNPTTIQTSNTERSFKYFLMHEVFHEYRQVPVWKNVNELSSSIYVEERNKEQYQLLLTELSILDKAWATSNKNELINILSDFITIRDDRYSKFEYMKQEKSVETLEGCAQYTEYKYSNQVGDIVTPPLTANGKTYKFTDVFSKKSLQDFTSKSSLNGFMDKDLYYYVGSLEGMLLDKLQVNWKDRVENNELIYDVLRDEVLIQKSDSEKSLEYIKNEYGYDNFSQQAEIIINNLK